MSKWWSAIAFAVLLTVGAAWLLAHEGHAALPSRGAKVDAAKGHIVLSRDSRDALEVRAIQISTRPVPESILAYATIVAPWQRHGFASSRLPGRILKLHARPGDRVEAGQILAEVVSADLENLHLEVLAAQSEQKLANQTLAILREAAGATSRQSILEAELKGRQADNGVVVARAKWLALGLNAKDLDALLTNANHRVAAIPVRSPVGGTVIHCDVGVGKVIATGEHIFEIIDLSLVWAKIGILEKDIHRTKVGQTVELRLAARPNEPVRGTIQAMGMSLDPTTFLNSAWVDLTNPKDGEAIFLPGMSGQARIQMELPADARVVPVNALIDDGLAQYVLVEEARAEKQSEYRRKNVVVVRPTADQVEVRAPGLFPGDRVVTDGAHELGSFFVPQVLKLSPEAEKTINLVMGKVSRQSIATVIEVEGHVDVLAQRRAVASTPLAGNIERILVDRGQAVVAGQVLAEIYSIDAKNLQLELIREQLALNFAEQQLQGIRNAGAAVAQKKRIEAEAERDALRFRRDNLRNRLTIIGWSAGQIDEMITSSHVLDRIPIKSPIAGVISGLDRAIGESVKADESVFTIHDLSHPFVQGLVPERDARHMRVGQSARVRLVSNPITVFTGQIARSSRVVSSDNQALKVWLDVPELATAQVRDGQLANVSIVVEIGQSALAVPNSAILRDGSRDYVFIRKADGAMDRRPVVTGRRDDLWTEVLSGVTEGEDIAVNGVQRLQTAFASIR